LTTCIVSEKNWNTKEEKSKSTMHVLYWQKGTSWDEVMLSSTKIKPVTLIGELCLAGGII